MTDFNEAVELIFSFEGGYVDDAQDNGGKTKYGISKKSFPKEDIINLKRERAKILYKEYYWDKVKADKLPSGVDIMVFDTAVNSGGKRAIKMLQGIVGAKQDGIIGSKTLAKVKRRKSKDIIIHFNVERLLYYTKCDDFLHFGKGWFNRAMKCFIVSLTKAERR